MVKGLDIKRIFCTLGRWCHCPEYVFIPRSTKWSLHGRTISTEMSGNSLINCSSTLTTYLLQCWWVRSSGSLVLQHKHMACVSHDKWWHSNWTDTGDCGDLRAECRTHPHTLGYRGSLWLLWYCPCVWTSQSPQCECPPEEWHRSARCFVAGESEQQIRWSYVT